MNTPKKRPKSFYEKIGAKGGKAVVEKHGKEYMAKLAKKGGMATRNKYLKYAGRDQH